MQGLSVCVCACCLSTLLWVGACCIRVDAITVADDFRLVASLRRMRSIVRASGGVREAADVIDLVYRIGDSFLLPLDLHMPWYKVSPSQEFIVR